MNTERAWSDFWSNSVEGMEQGSRHARNAACVISTQKSKKGIYLLLYKYVVTQILIRSAC